MATRASDVRKPEVAAGRDRRARDAELAMREYRADQVAADANTARLRALRLARDARAKDAESAAKKPAKKRVRKAP